jgi:hypothetical protein
MYDSGYGVTHGWQGEGEWLGELLAVPLDPRFPEPVRAAYGTNAWIWLCKVYLTPLSWLAGYSSAV